jgi:hypothetical protein
MTNWGFRMRGTIEEVSGSGASQVAPYKVEQATELYPTCGTATDYAFSRNPLNRIYSYTVEFGSTFVERFDLPNQLVAPFKAMRDIIDDAEFLWPRSVRRKRRMR